MIGVTIRYIPELHGHYLCRDVGCSDFVVAAANRDMVHHQLYTIGYALVEEAVKHTPRSQPLASWIPRGQLPGLYNNEVRRDGGEETD